MRKSNIPVRTFVLALLFGFVARPDENWPQWRGPNFTGHVEASGLPVAWSESENIVWKVELPSWSGSTPIIWGDNIFVTSPSKGEKGGHGSTADRPSVGKQILLLCVDKKTGALRWERGLDVGNEKINKQNDSSPSPVTDGHHVWALTGTGTLAAFTVDGAPLWRRNLQEMYGAFGLQFGYGSSPLLYDGMIIVQTLHGFFTDDPSYVVAFDGITGEVRWHVERPTDAPLESPDAYSTPLPVTHDGQTVIVVSSGDYVTGHDPATGEEVWRAGGLNPEKSERNRIIASSVACCGMVFSPSRQKPLLALLAGGSGDVTAGRLVWKWEERYGTDVPTPACDGAYLYMVDDRGMATCLEPATGKALWGPERTARGVVSASPLVADGKVYITNEDAVTTVLAAGPEYKKLATNTLDKVYTLSSIAVSGDRLYLRTATHLYCIGEQDKQDK
ncbi:MAG TPA: hypothetical protein ENN29_04440 [Candidatus Hydrogenedentes bacterium]|nr:hypothetical protein [Candidatus Hydrogenedentota bacterium]